MKVFFIRGFWIVFLFGGFLSQAAVNSPDDGKEQKAKLQQVLYNEPDITIEEIALQMGISIKTVENLLKELIEEGTLLVHSNNSSFLVEQYKNILGLDLGSLDSSKPKPNLEEMIEVLKKKGIQSRREYLKRRDEFHEPLRQTYNTIWSNIQKLDELHGEKLDQEFTDYLMEFEDKNKTGRIAGKRHISKEEAHPDLKNVGDGKGRLMKILLDEWEFQMIEEIETRAFDIIGQQGQLIQEISRYLDVEGLESVMEGNILFVEAEQLRRRAKEAKQAGNEISANLYEAEAEMADLIIERSVFLNSEVSIANSILAKFERTENENLREQVKKYVEYIRFEMQWIAPYALFETLVRLHEARAVLYAVRGAQEKSEKYKESAERLAQAAQFQDRANIYKIAGDREQATLYQKKASELYALRFKDKTKMSTQDLTDKMVGYSKKAYQYPVETSIAQNYMKAAVLMLKAIALKSVFSSEEMERRIAVAEDVAKEASNRARSCRDNFGSL